MPETVAYIGEQIDALRGSYICVSNVHTTVLSYEDEHYRMVQNSAAMALPDGAPLSKYSRARGFRDAQRVTGPDLMAELFRISGQKGYRHFFLWLHAADAGRYEGDTSEGLSGPGDRWDVRTAVSGAYGEGGSGGDCADQRCRC